MIIGFFYIYKDHFVHEGFETPSSYCAAGGPNQCSTQCYKGAPDPLPRESSNEEAIYDLYEQENINSIREPPASMMNPYNTGQQLTDFTVGASVPWDYDNLSMDPRDTVWGMVFPSCSVNIYYKAYYRVVYGSGNNFEYNVNTGDPVYRDPQFGIATTDISVQRGLETVAFFYQYIAGQLVSEPFTVLKYATFGLVDLDVTYNAHTKLAQFQLDARRGFSFDDSDEFLDARKKQRTPFEQRNKIEVIDPSTGKSIGPVGTKLTSEELATRRDALYNSILAAEKRNALADRLSASVGGATPEARTQNLEDALRRAGINDVGDLATKRAVQDGRPSGMAQAVFGPLGSKLAMRLPGAGFISRGVNMTVASVSNTVRSIGTSLGTFVPRSVLRSTLARSLARMTAKLGKAISVTASVASGLGMCSVIVAPLALAAGPGAVAFVGTMGAWCGSLNFGVTILAQAVVPAILQSITSDDSVCPKGMKTLYAAILESTPGNSEWLYTLLSSMPGIVGDFIGATGDFVCWSLNEEKFIPAIAVGTAAGVSASTVAVAGLSAAYVKANVDTVGAAAATSAQYYAAAGAVAMGTGMPAAIGAMAAVDREQKSTSQEARYNPTTGTWVTLEDTATWAGIKASLKIARVYPGYYYDSTLSIFFDNKPQILYTETSWKDPYAYTGQVDDNGKFTGPFPVWVDFADVRMLDKMAQFYNDYSRIYMSSNADGSVTFEYIKKMYAIVASSKYSCDVQCSINSITFMPQSGIVLCDIPVPTTPGNPTFYHDRRFYFWIDMSQGIQGDITDTLDDKRTALFASGKREELMSDNVAKYVVTGCTNTDGSAPDAVDVTSGETYVGDSVVSLGDVYNANTHVSESTAANLAEKGKVVREVSGEITNAFVKKAMGAETSSAYKDAVNALKILDIKGVTISDTSITTGRIDIQPGAITQYPDIPGYFYPPLNANVTPEMARNMIPDPTCTNVSDSMIRYGSATQAQQSDMQRRRPPVSLSKVSFKKSPTPIQWPGAKDYTAHTSAKIFHSDYTDMGVNGAGSGVQIGAGFVQNLITNGLPFGFGLIGMAAITALQSSGTLDYVRCMYQDMQYQDGSFVINDVLMSSHPHVMITRGPLITFAPGYTPTVNKCKNVFLQQTDCVSRYAIRRFLKKYDTEQRRGNTTTSLNKITKIHKIDTIQDVNGTGQQCVYAVGYTLFDVTTNVPIESEKKTILGVKMAKTEDMTCTYKPTVNDTTVYTAASPPPEQPPIIFTSRVDPPLTIAAFDRLVASQPGASEVPQAEQGIQDALNALSGAQDASKKRKQDNTTATGTAIAAAIAFSVGLLASAAIPAGGIGTIAAGAAGAATIASATTTGILASNAMVDTAQAAVNVATAWIILLEKEKQVATTANDLVLVNEFNKVLEKANAAKAVVEAARADAERGKNEGNMVKGSKAEAAAIAAAGNVGVIVQKAQKKLGKPSESKKQNPKFKLPKCTNVAYTPLVSAAQTTGCMYRPLLVNLVRQFNTNHVGTAFIDLTQNAVSAGFAINPSDPYEPTKCAYKVAVADVLRATTTTRIVTMTLVPPLINQSATNDPCMYNLAADDYPERFYLEHLPHTPLSVPDYLPESAQATLPTPNCATGTFTDCSANVIIENLVKQFNATHEDRQIYRVLSASTPSISQCDYQVEMSRQVNPGQGNSRIVHQDSIRMSVQQNPTNKCTYDLVTDGTNVINSGLSLLSGNPPPPLKVPYLFTTNILQTATTSLNTYIQSMLGLPIDTTLSTITTESNKNMQTVLQNVYNTNAPFVECPTETCKTPSVMRAIVNRYNYDNYPPYPSGQYGYTQGTITEIRRAGSILAPAGQSCCHLELIERQDVYDDYLQKPIPSLTKFFLRKYQFYLINGDTQCSYTVKPFTRADLSANIMDISSNAYGIFGDGSALSSPAYMSSANIPCFNIAVLNAVKGVYNSMNIAPRGQQVKYNKLVSVQRGFNPLPNVCEYLATVDHVFYDENYGKLFYTVKGSTTYLRATWSTADTGGSRYNVDTGAYSGTPLVEEFFPPLLKITSAGVNQKLQTGVLQTNIQLPYLYFENISEGNSRVETGPDQKGFTFPTY